MAIKVQGDTVIFDDKVFKVGSGNTAQRPVSPTVGMIRHNTDSGKLETYSANSWISFGGTDEFTQTLTVIGL